MGLGVFVKSQIPRNSECGPTRNAFAAKDFEAQSKLLQTIIFIKFVIST
jgi:hypothetical protein